MATATAEALSDAAREFVNAGPHKLLIGGERLEAADARTFATIDPATGEPICEFALGGPEDVDRAVAATRAALDGPLRKVSASKRAGLMYTLAELRLTELNGRPGAIYLGTDGKAIGTMTLEFADGRIAAIHSVVNPDKLAAVRGG